MQNRLWLLSVSFLFVSIHVCLAQKSKDDAVNRPNPDFGPEITSASLTISGEKHDGYAAQFDFAPDELQKGWWKYVKTTARVKNRKTYWELSIPPEKGESNIPVEMFSEIKKNGSKAVLTLVLNSVNMEASTRKKYMGQTKNLLQEFKAKYYGDYIQTKLEDAEKRAYKASREHQKYVATTIRLKSKLARDPGNSEVKNAYLEAIAAESKKEEGLKKIQSEIEFLKKTLFSYIQKST